MKLTKNRGQYIVTGLNLSLANEMYLDMGEALDVNVSLVDERHITERQRKFIHAYLQDMCDYTGEDKEFLRAILMKSYEVTKGIERGSMTMYSQTEASELIDCIVEYGISKGFIDVNRANEYEYQFDERQTYTMALQRVCCVCGRHHSDIHHVTQIGTKGNRQRISHVGLKALPLCREHHTEWHTIGETAFNNKYHVSPFVIDKKMEWFIKKGKIKEFK